MDSPRVFLFCVHSLSFSLTDFSGLMNGARVDGRQIEVRLDRVLWWPGPLLTRSSDDRYACRVDLNFLLVCVSNVSTSISLRCTATHGLHFKSITLAVHCFTWSLLLIDLHHWISVPMRWRNRCSLMLQSAWAHLSIIHSVGVLWNARADCRLDFFSHLSQILSRYSFI